MDKPMEHLKQWHNQFNGVLTANEAALYIHIFMMANRQFWPEWIRLTDSQLSLGTNINVKRIPELINSLVQKKLIVSDRGKGKAPSKYNLCIFTKDGCLIPNYTQTGAINEVQSGKKTRDKREINERYTGDKREINERLEESFPCESKDRKPSNTYTYTQQTTTTNNPSLFFDEETKKAIAIYEDVMRMPIHGQIESEMFIDLVHTYGIDNVNFAMKEAVRQNKRSMAYIEGILKNQQMGTKKHGSSQFEYPIQQGDDTFGTGAAL